MLKLGSSTLIVIVLATLASNAAAGNDPETLIRQGVELRRQGNDEAALPYLRKAYELSHTPRSSAQLGLCLSALSLHIEAAARLGEALISTTDAWINRQRQTLEKALSKTRSELATIEVTNVPPGGSILVNGESRGEGPGTVTILVIPGQLEVAIRAPGHRTFNTKLTVGKGQQAAVDGALSSIDVPQQPPASTTATPSTAAAREQAGISSSTTEPAYPLSSLKMAAIGTGVVSVASLATGLYFASRTNDFSDQYGSQYSANIKTEGQRAESLQYVFLGIGSAALIASAILYYMAPGAPPGSGAGLTVAPMVSPSGTGISVSFGTTHTGFVTR